MDRPSSGPSTPTCTAPPHTQDAGPPFGYLQGSSAITPFQHPAFRQLELLLPASLWSESFIQARSRYTLTATTPSPPPSSFHCTATGAERKEERAVHCDDGATGISVSAQPESPCATRRPTWSFMAIYRNYKRARDARASHSDGSSSSSSACGGGEMEEKYAKIEETAHQGSRESCSPCAPAVTAAAPSLDIVYASGRTGCAEIMDSPDCPHAAQVQGDRDSIQGLSSASHNGETSSSSSSSSFVSFCAGGEEEEEGMDEAILAHADPSFIEGCDDSRLALSDSLMCRPVPSPAALAAVLQPMHQNALAVLARVLRAVVAVHGVRCPLCSPARPPRWGKTTVALNGNSSRAPLLMERRDAETTTTTTTTAAADSRAPVEVTNAEESAGDRDALRRRAMEVLQRHDERLRYLWETKPEMIRMKVAAHPLVLACAQLGGLALLRALTASL